MFKIDFVIIKHVQHKTGVNQEFTSFFSLLDALMEPRFNKLSIEHLKTKEIW